MGGGEIEINSAHLRAAGESCGSAADSIRKADEELAGGSPGAGIFGQFAEATAFHDKFTAAHQSHRDRLQGHHSVLRRSSDQAELAAQAFRNTDEAAAADLDASRGDFQ